MRNTNRNRILFIGTFFYVLLFFLVFATKPVYAECLDGTTPPCINNDNISKNICTSVTTDPSVIIGVTQKQMESFMDPEFRMNAGANPKLLSDLNYSSIEEWQQHLNNISEILYLKVTYDKNSNYLNPSLINKICGGVDESNCNTIRERFNYYGYPNQRPIIEDASITIPVLLSAKNREDKYFSEFLIPTQHTLNLYYQNNQTEPLCKILFNVEPHDVLPTSTPTPTPLPTLPPSLPFFNCRLQLSPTHIASFDDVGDLSFRLRTDVSIYQIALPITNFWYKSNKNPVYKKLVLKPPLPWSIATSKGYKIFTSQFILTDLINLNKVTDIFSLPDTYSIKVDVAEPHKKEFYQCDVQEFTLIETQPTATPTPTPTPTKTPEQEEEAENKVKLRKICDLLPHTIKEDNGTTTTPASAAQDMAFDSCNACVTGENQKTGSNNDEQKAPYPGESGSYTAIGCLPTDIPTFLQRYLWTYGLGIAGGIGFLLMLWGAFTILISMGDAKKIEHGRELIISALVGILFIIFSILILRVVGVDILKIPEFS